MRVAFIVEKFPNISETFILDEIVGALRRGIEVDVYALRRGTAADIHPAYLKYGLEARTFYCVPAARGRIARLFAAVPATVKMLRRNHSAFLYCLRSRKRGLQSRTFVSLARSFVNSGNRYNIVHAHFGPNGVRAEVLRRATAFDAPIITTFHGYDATSFVTHHGPSAYADLAEYGERFIAVSQSMARSMRAIGIPESRTKIMPLGVDCSAFARVLPVKHDDTIRVISIGRFVEKKGLEYGIGAVVEARRQGVSLRYDIVGDGELRTNLEATVARLDASDFVVFDGWKNQTEVAALLSTADIMLVPSVTATNGDQESMPIVVKEAMALGLPVVATRHAGIPEIVVHGETGLLAPERDSASLAGFLIALAGDAGQRMRLGNAGRALIESTYDNERLVDELVALYREVAAQSTGDSSDIRDAQSACSRW